MDNYIGAPYDKGSATSKEAAASIISKLSNLELKVFKHIHAQGIAGSTCDEAEIALDMSHQTCSARFRGLVLKEAIYDSGVKRPTRTGRNATVYQTK